MSGDFQSDSQWMRDLANDSYARSQSQIDVGGRVLPDDSFNMRCDRSQSRSQNRGRNQSRNQSRSRSRSSSRQDSPDSPNSFFFGSPPKKKKAKKSPAKKTDTRTPVWPNNKLANAKAEMEEERRKRKEKENQVAASKQRREQMEVVEREEEEEDEEMEEEADTTVLENPHSGNNAAAAAGEAGDAAEMEPEEQGGEEDEEEAGYMRMERREHELAQRMNVVLDAKEDVRAIVRSQFVLIVGLTTPQTPKREWKAVLAEYVENDEQKAEGEKFIDEEYPKERMTDEEKKAAHLKIARLIVTRQMQHAMRLLHEQLSASQAMARNEEVD